MRVQNANPWVSSEELQRISPCILAEAGFRFGSRFAGMKSKIEEDGVAEWSLLPHRPMLR